MPSKTFDNPVPPKTIKLEYWQKLIQKIQDSVEEHPINRLAINEVIFKVTSPNFKYPEIEKCCNTCQVSITNQRFHKALDKIKTMSENDSSEDLMEKIDELNYIFGINSTSLKGSVGKIIR